jgi:hypothetical protein
MRKFKGSLMVLVLAPGNYRKAAGDEVLRTARKSH